MSKVISSHIFYPDTYPNSSAYDLRWVISFVHAGDQAVVRFYGAANNRVYFDWASFKSAWDISRSSNPALPATPAISVNLPAYQINDTYFNTLMVGMWYEQSVNPDVEIAVRFSSGQSYGADGYNTACIDSPIMLDKADFMYFVPTEYPLWAASANRILNLDHVVSWREGDNSLLYVNFHGYPLQGVDVGATAFETAMQASKSR